MCEQFAGTWELKSSNYLTSTWKYQVRIAAVPQTERMWSGWTQFPHLLFLPFGNCSVCGLLQLAFLSLEGKWPFYIKNYSLREGIGLPLVLTAVCNDCAVGRVFWEKGEAPVSCKSVWSRQVHPPEAVNYVHLFKVNLRYLLKSCKHDDSKCKKKASLWADLLVYFKASSYLGAGSWLSPGKYPINGLLSLGRDFQWQEISLRHRCYLTQILPALWGKGLQSYSPADKDWSV